MPSAQYSTACRPPDEFCGYPPGPRRASSNIPHGLVEATLGRTASNQSGTVAVPRTLLRPFDLDRRVETEFRIPVISPAQLGLTLRFLFLKLFCLIHLGTPQGVEVSRFSH